MYKTSNDSKYNIVAEQAYTEDNILIYNIFSKNIPKDATKIEISKYFQRFGKVLDVRLVGKNEGRKCFVDFEDSKVAAKVLQKTNYFKNNRLKLQACQSYHQPDGLKIIAQLTENSKNNTITEEATASCCNDNSIRLQQNALILNLNDDCLEHICKQLTPKDQINFALTCQRFCEIFKMISSVEYRTLSADTFIYWTPWQVRLFLQLVGSQVKTLIVDFIIIFDADSRWKMTTYIKFLSLFCTNVEMLLVFSCDVPSSLLRTLFGNMKQLKELELCNTNDNLIKYLKKFKNLKSLSITNNSNITGKNINLLTGLEKLSLYECYNLSSYHFKKICTSLKNLQYLDIRSCEQFETEDFQKNFENLLELKTLKLTTTKANFNCLAQLPNLTHLELHNSGYPTPEKFFKILAKHQTEQLEELRMQYTVRMQFDVASYLAELKKLKVFHCDNHEFDDDGLMKLSKLKELEEICCTNCEGITDKSALEILKNCLKLKRLHLMRCFSIKPEFINNCISLLKEQKERWLRSDRVNIQLSETGPLRSKLKTIPKEDYSDVLEITLYNFFCWPEFF